MLKFSLQLETVPPSVAMMYLHLQPAKQVTIRHLRKNRTKKSTRAGMQGRILTTILITIWQEFSCKHIHRFNDEHEKFVLR